MVFFESFVFFIFGQTDEYIPVKEKVKMIAMQQEEIFRKEELKRQTTGHVTLNNALTAIFRYE